MLYSLSSYGIVLGIKIGPSAPLVDLPYFGFQFVRKNYETGEVQVKWGPVFKKYQ